MPIIDDSLIEANETFGLILSNVVGTAALGLSSAAVTIVDNDFKAGVQLAQIDGQWNRATVHRAAALAEHEPGEARVRVQGEPV